MTKSEKVDAYKVVTDRIIAALEAGIVPWHRPWRTDGGPRSLSTGKAYQGVNVWTLSATAALRGYDSPWWCTFKQAQERGGTVRKGEHGTPVVFWRFIEKKDPKTGDVVDRIPLLRYFTVFNADQCDDITVPAPVDAPDYEPIEAADEISHGYLTHGGPGLRHGGDRASYSPRFDRVRMPKREQFESIESYYATLFHELAHSTGHESRLARKGIEAIGPFGTPEYSREELVAEMAAAFLCGDAGIPVDYPQHSGYVGSWLRVLGSDSKMVVQAAAAAQKAADLILSGSAPVDSEPVPAEPEMAVA